MFSYLLQYYSHDEMPNKARHQIRPSAHSEYCACILYRLSDSCVINILATQFMIHAHVYYSQILSAHPCDLASGTVAVDKKTKTIKRNYISLKSCDVKNRFEKKNLN